MIRNGYHYQSPFQEWVKSNARALLNGPLGTDIKENGLFVVTQTYATEKVALTAWKNAESKAYFGFGVGATGLGELSPNVQWYTGHSESGWNVHEAEPGELKVVFVGGLAYRRLWPLPVGFDGNSKFLLYLCRPKNQLHRTNSPSRGTSEASAENRILVSGPGTERLELECKIWGVPLEGSEDYDSDEDAND